jgi:hypothetical protein
MEVSTSSILFVSEFLESRNRLDVDGLVGRYSSAFGSSFTDGVRPMVGLFSKEVSASRLTPATVEGLYTTLYLLLGEVTDMLKSIRLVAFPRNGQELSELRKNLQTSAREQSRGGYGSLLVPPSTEAATVLASMTEEESLNFKDLLERLQEWHESAVGKGSLNFHPEARASLWGTALAKIADHYREIGRNERALFFANAAWTLSRYPVFAFNVGILAMAAGDTSRGKNCLQTYLDEYPKVLTTPSLRLVAPEVTEEELERLAKIARSKLGTLAPREAGSHR